MGSRLCAHQEARNSGPSWFNAVLSRIRLHSLRMSSVSACKHGGCLDGRSSPSSCAVKRWSRRCTGGASYRPRHTPSESLFKTLDSQFKQRVALIAVSDVPHAARTRHMLRASQRPNEDGACGQAARLKVARNSLLGVYRAMRRL